MISVKVEVNAKATDKAVTIHKYHANFFCIGLRIWSYSTT